MHADILEWHFMLNPLQGSLEFGAQDFSHALSTYANSPDRGDGLAGLVEV